MSGCFLPKAVFVMAIGNCAAVPVGWNHQVCQRALPRKHKWAWQLARPLCGHHWVGNHDWRCAAKHPLSSLRQRFQADWASPTGFLSVCVKGGQPVPPETVDRFRGSSVRWPGRMPSGPHRSGLPWRARQHVRNEKAGKPIYHSLHALFKIFFENLS